MVQVAGVGRHETSFGAEAPDKLGKWAKVGTVCLVIIRMAMAIMTSEIE